ncbi:glycine-rich domain-containing protein [Streptomyces sp. NPDC093249]|uniref:glycine-rich domain-containing protein n=1 Tax=unclassified Streptomyces TaxID=2593676 RepID=UPI003808E2B8
MTTVTTESRDVRAMLSVEEFNGVAATVMDTNPGMSEEDASRIVAEALKFVFAAAMFPGGMRPSRVVDEGWHALILHTTVYRDFCRRAGRFVHHVPERPDPTRHDPTALEKTQANIEKAGFVVDRTLWLGPSSGLIPVAAECEHISCGDSDCQVSCRSDHPN